jgi:hypothetical protein
VYGFPKSSKAKMYSPFKHPSLHLIKITPSKSFHLNSSLKWAKISSLLVLPFLIRKVSILLTLRKKYKIESTNLTTMIKLIRRTPDHSHSHK